MKRLLVAVHDVTPALAPALAKIYALLDQLGVARYALLVVPNWHGEWPLDRHVAFVDDLLRRQAAGAEIFLHGYRHDESGFRRTWMQRVSVAGRTAASAEFYIAPPDEMTRRLDQGLALFRRLGLRPTGFVPPAWLHGAGLEDRLRQRDLTITEGFWAISDLTSGRRVWAPALSWSTAQLWRSYLTSGIAGVRRGLEAARGLVRVAIHPPDISVPVVARSLRTTLRHLARARRLTTYGGVYSSPFPVPPSPAVRSR